MHLSAKFRRILLPTRHASVALYCLSLTLASAAIQAQPRAVTAELAGELQPLRILSQATLAPQLKTSAAWLAKGKFAKACDAAELIRADLLHKAAKLFYKVDRRAGSEPDEIEKFLDQYVRSKTPLLAVPLDVFAPAQGFRALGVDACVRAGKGALAARFVAEAGSANDGGDDERPRVALAVALAVAAGQWSAATAVLGQNDSLRANLLRALAAEPKEATRLLEKARSQAKLPQDFALVQLVAKALAEPNR